MKAYPSVSEGGTLRPSIVVFLDILGFRALMAGTKTSGEATAALKKIRAAFDAAGHWINGNSMLDGHQGNERGAIRAFTDKLVVGYPLTAPGREGEPELGSIFMHLAFFQFALIQQGFFVRGAIGCGDL